MTERAPSPRSDRDAIIGVAFWRSLYVVGGIGVVVGGVLLARTLLEEEPVREVDELSLIHISEPTRPY